MKPLLALRSDLGATEEKRSRAVEECGKAIDELESSIKAEGCPCSTPYAQSAVPAASCKELAWQCRVAIAIWTQEFLL